MIDISLSVLYHFLFVTTHRYLSEVLKIRVIYKGGRMFSKVSFFALCVSLFLTGCASSPATWQQSGVSPYDMQSALSECKYQIGLKDVPSSKEKELVAYCMESKGYRWMH
jgi:hypothetical protein